MSEEKQKLREMVDRLRRRRGMFVAEQGYLPIVNFLVGYMTALSDLSGRSFHHDFHEWLKQRTGRSFSVLAEYYVLHHMAGNDEAKAETLLYDLLEEFCKEE